MGRWEFESKAIGVDAPPVGSRGEGKKNANSTDMGGHKGVQELRATR